MTHSEIQKRNQLITYLQQVQDQNIIDEVLRMLRINFDDQILETTEVQKRGIEVAQAEYANGKGLSAEQADREIDEWLKD